MPPDHDNRVHRAAAVAASALVVAPTLAGFMDRRTCTIQRQPPEFRRFPVPGKKRSFGDFDRSRA